MVEFDKYPYLYGDGITVYLPEIDFFLDKIKNNKYFSMIRFPDQWWKATGNAMKSMGVSYNIKSRIINDSDILNKFASHILIGGRSAPYTSSIKILRNNILTMISNHDDNFYISVKADLKDRREIAKRFLYNDKFIYAHIWRKFATDNVIDRLFFDNNDIHFIIVGPFFYKNLSKKLSLDNISFIEISETEAHKNVNYTINSIISLREKILKKKVICLFSAGAVSTYMISKLYNILPETYLIDMGRTLDAYYCHDKVLKNGPHWRWAGAWFGSKDNMKDWTKWTLKYKE